MCVMQARTRLSFSVRSALTRVCFFVYVYICACVHVSISMCV